MKRFNRCYKHSLVSIIIIIITCTTNLQSTDRSAKNSFQLFVSFHQDDVLLFFYLAKKLLRMRAFKRTGLKLILGSCSRQRTFIRHNSHEKVKLKQIDVTFVVVKSQSHFDFKILKSDQIMTDPCYKPSIVCDKIYFFHFFLEI